MNQTADRVVDALLAERLLVPGSRSRAVEVVGTALGQSAPTTSTGPARGLPKLVEVVAYLGGSLVLAAVLLFGFAAACVGGFDSIKGAVVGGLLVGFVETFAPALFTFIGNELSLVMVLLVILIVLYVRPQGLFGTKRVERV